MATCENGHSNQTGGCCCPAHGNTCGFCPEHDQANAPDGFDALAEYLVSQPGKPGAGISSLDELAASSPAWGKRLREIQRKT